MSFPRMHDDQVDVGVDDLRRLLDSQFPQWAERPISRVLSSGTDNTIYRLGDDLVVRLPLIEWAAGQIALEHEWLPKLAPHVPVLLHEPLVMGSPEHDYPWHWSVYRWLDGRNPGPDTGDDLVQLAGDLADFVRALRRVDLDVPRSSRGIPLKSMDDAIRPVIEQVGHQFDADVLLAIWDDAIAAPKWDGPWVPVHGDLSEGNLVMRDGRLHAVIDFSCFGVGDPANDVDVAWELFSGESRRVYRDALEVDDATWRRSRGWAVRSVYGIPYYEHTNPGIVARARRRLDHVIADWNDEQR